MGKPEKHHTVVAFLQGRKGRVSGCVSFPEAWRRHG